MYDSWNLGGLNPSFFVIWGGLAPPSPCVEPPLSLPQLFYHDAFTHHALHVLDASESDNLLDVCSLDFHKLSASARNYVNFIPRPTELSRNLYVPLTYSTR